MGGKLLPKVTDEGQICTCRKTPRRGEVTPPYTAIFLPASLSYKCARAARTPYLLSIISYLLFKLPRRGNLVPDGAPIRNILGNCNKKTPLLPPLICTFHSFPRGLSRGLTKPHWGFVVGRYAKRPTRPVLVPDGAPVRSVPGNRNKKNTPQLLARCLLWCTIGDSNPGPTD